MKTLHLFVRVVVYVTFKHLIQTFIYLYLYFYSLILPLMQLIIICRKQTSLLALKLKFAGWCEALKSTCVRSQSNLLLFFLLLCSSFNGQQQTWRLKSISAREKALQYQPEQKIHGFTVREVGGTIRSGIFQTQIIPVLL